MRLTVVGCSGSYPGPESSASCYLVEAEHGGRTWRILLDLGNGALGQLQRYVDAATIDGVFLSHLHADHCLDLCGYYVMRKYHPDGAMPRIPVWGPTDTAGRMARAYDLEEEPGMTEEFDFVPYGTTAIQVGPFTVTARRVVHPVTAYGLRIEADGRVLAYSGDTGVCHGLDDTAREADVFLCEASFMEGAPNPPDLHLTGAEAGRTAAGAGSRKLVLTHVPPWHDREQVLREAQGEYAGPAELAVPGATYDV
ncbi:Ribonuclease BN, tRNA processing enzyme [Nocardioides scoriae]|uniref:Ribonuclease BN, tRNA processing enzyme n=1 Tax=Nocardioides scoriae TaxID=642780 RepID=A0A1H1LFV3_9ACTN|nr:MBL fold metallo-hydrolase [Nocardioides scoriae]SDR73464.1 Ribonuclease BN, tRNA processing enzyme [Nocardioides scoriae]